MIGEINMHSGCCGLCLLLHQKLLFLIEVISEMQQSAVFSEIIFIFRNICGSVTINLYLYIFIYVRKVIPYEMIDKTSKHLLPHTPFIGLLSF